MTSRCSISSKGRKIGNNGKGIHVSATKVWYKQNNSVSPLVLELVSDSSEEENRIYTISGTPYAPIGTITNFKAIFPDRQLKIKNTND